MWVGILGFIFYYTGQLIFFLLEGSSPTGSFMGFGTDFYFCMALFWLFPGSFILSIWAIIRGSYYVATGKSFPGKVNLTCGITVLLLIIFSIPYSILMGFVDSFSYPPDIRNFIFHRNTFLAIHIIVAIFVVYRCFRYKRAKR